MVRVRVSKTLASHFPPLEREKAKASSFPKFIPYSVKVVVKVIGQKTLGVQNLCKL